MDEGVATFHDFRGHLVTHLPSLQPPAFCAQEDKLLTWSRESRHWAQGKNGRSSSNSPGPHEFLVSSQVPSNIGFPNRLQVPDESPGRAPLARETAQDDRLCKRVLGYLECFVVDRYAYAVASH